MTTRGLLNTKSILGPRGSLKPLFSAYLPLQSCSDLLNMSVPTAGDLVELPPRHLVQTQLCSGIKTIYNNWLFAF